MRFNHRRGSELDEGESYYISMTDMMVGVVFIFIILLSFFALQFRKSTAELTSAKDSQTSVLLTLAKNLVDRNATLQVDDQNKIVCIPGSILNTGEGSGAADRHCFAYTGEVKADKTQEDAKQQRSNFMAFLSADLDPRLKQDVSTETGNMSWRAEDLFVSGSANLSSNGAAVARDVADKLAKRLPCYGYGGSSPCAADAPKMSLVNVVGQTGFDAFTPEGRAAAALSLSRSVAFLQALTGDQPVLARLKNGAADNPNAQPLLRVATYGQSQSDNSGVPTIGIQFNMAN